VTTETSLVLPAGPAGDLAAATRQIAAWAAGLPGLPPDDGNRYSIRRLTVAWNLESWGRSRHTAIAHRRDLSTYLDWCVRERLDPLDARPADLAQFQVWRELGAGGRAAKPSTVARAVASVSSWYTHLVANTNGRVAHNPAVGVKRPKVNARTSTTAGLTLDEVDLLLAQADAEVADRAKRWRAAPTQRRRARYLAALRHRALLRLLADLGLRINEALDRDVADLSYNAGQRTLRFVDKGGDERERALPAHTLEGIDDYLAARAETTASAVDALEGPLFATIGAGADRGRLAGRLSPHSLRHAFATGARECGIPLEDVQDAMGHADPRTTRRYDRDRHNLDRDPAHVLGKRRASRRVGPAAPAEASEGDAVTEGDTA
jgi:integrase/recombinase XerD